MTGHSRLGEGGGDDRSTIDVAAQGGGNSSRSVHDLSTMGEVSYFEEMY